MMSAHGVYRVYEWMDNDFGRRKNSSGTERDIE